MIFGLCNQCEDDLYGNEKLDPTHRDFRGMATARVHCFRCYGRNVDNGGNCVDSGCARHHASAEPNKWQRAVNWFFGRTLTKR